MREKQKATKSDEKGEEKIKVKKCKSKPKRR